MFLTQQGGFIIRPIAGLLGNILELIYELLSKVGIVNIGVSIILFTALIRLLLLPSLIKQNKSTKVMNYIQPEINKVTKKYKGKKDQDSLLKQQKEVRDIQNKYGVSMTGGCLTSLIQMPIFLALYNVVQNIPAYVAKIYDYYKPIATSIMQDKNAVAAFQEFKKSEEFATTLGTVKLDTENVRTFVDVLAKLPSDGWNKLKEFFANPSYNISSEAYAQISASINDNVENINDVYSFIGGIDLSKAPGLVLSAALAIPLLSMAFQFLSMKVTPQQKNDDPAQQASMKMMRFMMYFFPAMSFVICINVPAALGLYWATGALLSFITTLCINIYFKHCNMERIVEKCKEKAAVKNEKRKASGKKSFMERMQEAALGQTESTSTQPTRNISSTSLKSYTSNTMKDNGEVKKYREGSLAAKANIMQKYNDNSSK